MEISINEGQNRVDVVSVKGRVDSATAPDLEKSIRGLFDKNRHQLVIDLAGVEYMSSAGLRTLVSSLKTAKSHGGNVVIAQPSARVREVIELAGLNTVLPIYDNVVDAVRVF
jgi:anti-anti-sigma factor